MEPATLSQIAQWIDASQPQAGGGAKVARVCTDTRALRAGDLFLALRGENFDGHTFVAEAARRGACGAVVDRDADVTPDGFPVLRVADTLAALQQMAAAYRRTLLLKVIGITGSNGKTSAKDFTAAVLSRRFRVLKTEGNLNNHIGVPHMMLRAEAAHEVAVIEMGMNHAGEIAPLARIAAPDAAIITNVGMAHIENLGTREGIAAEKSVLAEAVPASGTVILDAEDDFTPFIRKRTKASVVTTGLFVGDIRAGDIAFDEAGARFTVEIDGGKHAVRLPVPGVHMVRNALFAIAAGRLFGVPVEDCIAALADAELTKGRLEQKIIRGIHIIDDSYNANPDSMKAALRTVADLECKGRRIAVLGKMNELGEESDNGHREVGEAAAREGMDIVISVTPGASLVAVSATTHGVREVFQTMTTQEAGLLLRKLAREGDIVLVKGSRGVRMEKAIEEFAR
jgi:UDP-N-acetylmuramoyl-tripeptide--D-alanyl-D-alanine ligase